MSDDSDKIAEETSRDSLPSLNTAINDLSLNTQTTPSSKTAENKDKAKSKKGSPTKYKFLIFTSI